MTAWNDMVKKVAKGNPGKSLKEILPLAKVEYRKTHKVVEHKKKGTHKKKGKKHGVHKKRRQRGGDCGVDHGSNGGSNGGPNGGSNNDVPNDGPVVGGEPVAANSEAYADNAIQKGGKRRRGKRGSKGKRRSKRGSKAKRRSKGKRSMKNHKKGCKCVICMHHHH